MTERVGELESVVELADLIDALQDKSAEELIALGLSTGDTWDEIDDPVLIGPNGLPIETWREGYPYTQRMTRRRVRGGQAAAADRAVEGSGMAARERRQARRRVRGA